MAFVNGDVRCGIVLLYTLIKVTAVGTCDNFSLHFSFN